MRVSLNIFVFCLAVIRCYSSVTIAEYYDNRQMAVTFRSDDMSYWPGTSSWDPYLAEADFCATNRVVYTAGIIPYYIDSSDVAHGSWASLSSSLNQQPYFRVASHSYGHQHGVTNITGTVGEFPVGYVVYSYATYYYNFIYAKERMQEKLPYNQNYTYNGEKFNTSMILWGSAYASVVTNTSEEPVSFPDLDGELMYDYCSTNGYLGIAAGQNQDRVDPYDYFDMWLTDTATGVYPEWNTDKNMFWNYGHNESMGAIYDGQEQWRLDAAYARFYDIYTNGGVYNVYGHAYTQGWLGDSEGEAFVIHIGNRHDVWYCSPEDIGLYRYLSDQNPPTITVNTSNSVEVVFTVDGSSLPRSTYGLSYPISYMVDKPTEWAAEEGYVVSYKDTGTWSDLALKSTNDWYNDVSCYRDGVEAWGETNLVVVSKGLPQNSDSFQIRVRRQRTIPAFFIGPSE